MPLLEIKSLCKSYPSNDGQVLHVLRIDSLLSFPKCFLVGISGSSGSGKSTFLNLIGLLDSPSFGEVIYKGKNVFKFKNKEKQKYFNSEIGFVFQNPTLLDFLTVKKNLCMALSLKGYSRREQIALSEKWLKMCNVDEQLWNKNAGLLSGGERQRVCLARTLCFSPNVILADEPTGALDPINSELVMRLLKEYSKDHLVFVVSHDKDLLKKYSNQLITFSDGHIIENKIISSIKDSESKTLSKRKFNSNFWEEQLSFSNYKRRFKRGVFSGVTLSFSLLIMLLSIGFKNNASSAISIQSKNQFDYGVTEISEKKVINKNDNGLSLVRLERPNKNSLVNQNLNAFFNIDCNYKYFFNPVTVSVEETNYDVSFCPIYSFEEKCINDELIVSGALPFKDSLKEVIVNSKAAEMINTKKFHVNYSSTYQDLSTDFNVNYEIEFDYDCKICGICKDLSFLCTPKIYYSYCALQSYLDDYFEDFSLTTSISMSASSDPITSYSLMLFPKDYKRLEEYEDYISSLGDDYLIESESITIAENLHEVIIASSKSLTIYLLISILGSICIMGIISFSSYVEDRKYSALLTSLGSSNGSIKNVYFNEGFILCLIAVLFSSVLSKPISLVINKLLLKYLGINNLIKIPWKQFLGLPYLLPFLLILASSVICFSSTSLPISFSKKSSIKNELSYEC